MPRMIRKYLFRRHVSTLAMPLYQLQIRYCNQLSPDKYCTQEERSRLRIKAAAARIKDVCITLCHRKIINVITACKMRTQITITKLITNTQIS